MRSHLRFLPALPPSLRVAFTLSTRQSDAFPSTPLISAENRAFQVALIAFPVGSRLLLPPPLPPCHTSTPTCWPRCLETQRSVLVERMTVVLWCAPNGLMSQTTSAHARPNRKGLSRTYTSTQGKILHAPTRTPCARCQLAPAPSLLTRVPITTHFFFGISGGRGAATLHAPCARLRSPSLSLSLSLS
eukprot:RCo047793